MVGPVLKAFSEAVRERLAEQGWRKRAGQLVSNRRLRRRFEMRTHRDRLWSPSYLAASAGDAPLSIIRQYVATQRRPA